MIKPAGERPESLPQGSRLRQFFRVNGIGLAFLLPALCFYTLFQWGPILYNFLLAFQNYTPGLPPVWVGLQNFQRVLSDSVLPQAIANTFAFAGWALLIGYAVPIVAAIVITELRRGRAFFRLAIYLPNIIPAIALYIMWIYMFHPTVGLLNQILQFFGLPGLEWLLAPKLALVSLVIMSTWANFGSTAVLYMASITAIQAELYEAAEIDGAGIGARIRHITLPALQPTMVLLLLLQLLATLQVLQEPFVMTGGGPNNATMTLMYLAYNYAFVNAEFGKAGALGMLLFLLLMVLSLIYVKLTKVVGQK
jgi:multiple sugar transport system permease protein